MEIRYNEEMFDLTVQFNRYNKGGSIIKQEVLNTEFLQSLRFISDMEYAFPVAEIAFIDWGDLFQTTFLADGFSTVEIVMLPIHTAGPKGEPVQIAIEFIVDFSEIVDKVRSETILQITAVGIDRFTLNSKLEYSTGSDPLGRPILKPTTEIIEEILGNINFPFSRSEFFRTCKNEIHYISPSNATVKLIIDDLLRNTISTESGIYSLYFSLLDNEAKFLSLKTLLSNFSETGDVEGFNTFNIHDDGNDNINPVTISTIRHVNGLAASKLSGISGASDMNVFNYEKRKWKTETYDNLDYNDVTGFVNSPVQFQNKRSVLIQDVPKHLVKPEHKYESENVSHYDFNTYKKHGNADIETDTIYNNFLNMETIQFNIKGLLQREVGNMIRITQSTDSSKPRYEGYWFIKRIILDFKNGLFVNNIIASRPNIKEGK